MFSKKKNPNFFLATNFFPTNSNGVSTKKKKKKKNPLQKIIKDVLKIFLEVDSILCPNLFDYSSLSFLIL